MPAVVVLALAAAAVAGLHAAPRLTSPYPLIELATGLAGAAVTLALTSSSGRCALPAYLYLAGLGVLLCLADLEVRRLPDALVLPSYPLLGALRGAAAWRGHDGAALVRAGLGAGALFALYLLLAAARPGALGAGDVKLAGLLGAALAYLSWSALILGALLGFALGALSGLVVLAAGGDRRSVVPYGPAMIGGTLLVVVLAGAGAATGPAYAGSL